MLQIEPHIAATKPLCLNHDEVHIWHAKLNYNKTFLHQLYQALSPDEQGRANRYRFYIDKNHFIAARGILRKILSRYLNKAPEEISLVYNSQGKPALKDAPNNQRFMFNVSHSHDMALYAIAKGINIGIDIEKIRNDIAYDKIATRFFSEQEVSVLHSLPTHLKARTFYNCWTRKEAYLKALGEGLNIPLNQFSVSLAPGEPAALSNCQWDPDEPARWSLYELDIGHEYVATLAVEGNPANITCKPWCI